MDAARNRIVPALIFVLALAAAGFGAWWWFHGRHIETTDNAYVEADIAVMAAKVPGYVADVVVADNQPVRRGDPLVVIDDADYRAALARAEAEVERLARAEGSAGARASAGTGVVAETRAALLAAEAQARRAAADAERAEDLLERGFATRAMVDARRAEAESAAALVAERQAAIRAAEAGRQAARGDIGGASAALKAAIASREAAALDLANTVIRAPVDGIVGNRMVRPGQFARQGQQLLVVVPASEAYVVANFKETQIAGLQPGAPATITLDAWPDQPLQARVDSFSPASGSRFSVIPPENATGNFTRIVARLPVKLVLEQPLPPDMRLAPGLSARVRIDTRDAPIEQPAP